MSAIVRARRYPHPVERVWRMVATAEGLAAWLMPNDFRPEVGHAFTFTTRPAPGFDGTVRCRVVEVDPLRRVRFTWAGGPVDTVVTFDLEPDGPSATVLRLSQTGFDGAAAQLVRLVLGSGWRGLLGRRLPAALAAGA